MAATIAYYRFYLGINPGQAPAGPLQTEAAGYLRARESNHNIHFGGGLLSLQFNFPAGGDQGTLSRVLQTVALPPRTNVRLFLMDRQQHGFSHAPMPWRRIHNAALRGGATWAAFLQTLRDQYAQGDSDGVDFDELAYMTVIAEPVGPQVWHDGPTGRNQTFDVPQRRSGMRLRGGCTNFILSDKLKEKTRSLALGGDIDNDYMCGLRAIAYVWAQYRIDFGVTTPIPLRETNNDGSNKELSMEQQKQFTKMKHGKQGKGIRKKFVNELFAYSKHSSREEVTAKKGCTMDDMRYFLGVVCDVEQVYLEVNVWMQLAGGFWKSEVILPKFHMGDENEELPTWFEEEKLVATFNVLLTNSADPDVECMHWLYINSIQGLFPPKTIVCLTCFGTYRSKTNSKKTPCPGCEAVKCGLCKSRKADHQHMKGPYKECATCAVRFTSMECYHTHLQNETCSEVRRCTTCNHRIVATATKASGWKKVFEHKCGEYLCKGCKVKVESTIENPHYCYLDPTPKKHMMRTQHTQTCETIETAVSVLKDLHFEYSPEQRKLYEKATKTKKDPLPDYAQVTKELAYLDKAIIFSDFEATFDNPERQHHVNYICSEDQTGKQWPTFTTITRWLEYASEQHPEGATIIMHNGGGYDFKFIVPVLKEMGYDIDTLSMAGSRIKFFRAFRDGKRSWKDIGSLRFIDSASFLGMPLSAFASTFNLEAGKGYFPHECNSESAVVKTYLDELDGNCPEYQFFGGSWMSGKGQEDLKKWIEKRNDRSQPDWKPWVYADEMDFYCKQDVSVLRKGWLVFSDIIERNTRCADAEGNLYWGMLPHDDVTIPSTAMRMWKLYHNEKEGEEGQEHGILPRLPVSIHNELMPAMVGGRTGCVKMQWTQKEGMPPAQYVDFTSLYPYVNKNCRYPTNHPVVVTKEREADGVLDFAEVRLMFVEEPEDMYEDPEWLKNPDDLKMMVCKVDVECPQDLYLPLLHEKIEGEDKLMFTLRKKVACLYTGHELLKAQKLGYKITHMYKAWVWFEDRPGLFAGYINKFLKLKQEAAGFEGDDVKAYIADYDEKEGIELDPQKIQKNKGIYKTAKFFLNSLWGKFGQKNTEEYTNKLLLDGLSAKDRLIYAQLTKGWGRNDTPFFENKQVVKMPLGPGCVLKDAHTVVLDERFLIVGYNQDARKLLEGEIGADVTRSKNPYADRIDRSFLTGNQCAQVAIFTTAHARLKLYDLLEKLGSRVLYYDTDSCIFAPLAGEDPNVLAPLGKYLGDLTNELADPYNGDEKYGGDGYTYDLSMGIEYFISGGPKHYSYRLTGGKEVVKVKGIRTQRADVSKQLTMDDMEHAVVRGEGKVIHDSEMKTNNFKIYTINTEKHYRATCTKRKTVYNDEEGFIDTVPWTEENKLELVDVIVSLAEEQKKRHREEMKADLEQIGVDEAGEPIWNVMEQQNKRHCAEK